MATVIADFHEPLRIMLDDTDANFYTYQDAILDAGVRTAVTLGKLPGYTLVPASPPPPIYITPDIATPGTCALLLYHTVKLFIVSKPANQMWRTRAVGGGRGSLAMFLADIEQQIHRLENGSMLGSWGMFGTWFAGWFGLTPWQHLTEIRVKAPLRVVDLGTAMGRIP